MNDTLEPFIRHEMDNLPNRAHNTPAGPLPATGDEVYKNKSHCMACRQSNSESFLRGTTPGLHRHVAPEWASADAQLRMQASSPTVYRPSKNLAIEDDETVQRLLEWREQSPNS